MPVTTINYENGDIYKGEVDGRGRPHGEGTYTHSQESGQIQTGLYIGNWKDGEKHGTGIHYYRTGDIYQGPWVEGKKEGPKGKYIYHKNNSTSAESDVYIGDWHQNEKHGQGVMKFANGDKYKGRWIRGIMETLPDETATYTFHDRSKYVGAWKNNKEHGKGTLIYSNGDIYEGMFKNGLRHGRGKYKRSDGQVIEGTYENDIQTSYEIINERQDFSEPTVPIWFDKRNKEKLEVEDV